MGKPRFTEATSVGVLLTPVDPARSFPLWSKRAEEARDERAKLGMDLREAALAVRIPVGNLLLILSGRRALATPAAYALIVERMRVFATHRSRKAAWPERKGDAR